MKPSFVKGAATMTIRSAYTCVCEVCKKEVPAHRDREGKPTIPPGWGELGIVLRVARDREGCSVIAQQKEDVSSTEGGGEDVCSKECALKLAADVVGRVVMGA